MIFLLPDTRWLCIVVSATWLAACAQPNAARGAFMGPDAFAEHPGARSLTASIAEDAYTFSIAADRTGERIAYASPDGVFVADAGGPPRRIAERHGPINELVWSPDGRYLVYGEREVEEVCAPAVGHPGQVCSSSTADEIYRLRRVAVADGTAVTLAEHVRGFTGLSPAPAGTRVAFQRGDGPLGGDGALVVLEPATGEMTAVSGPHRAAAIAWSPDASAIAFIEPDPGSDDRRRARGVFRAGLAGESPTRLGEVPGDLAAWLYGPFWMAGGRAVRVVGIHHLRRIPVLEFPTDGALTREYALELEEPGFTEFRASPDGRWLLATRMKGLRERGNTVQISLEDGAIHDVGPAGMFMGWVGVGPRFIARVGQTAVLRYYIATPDTVEPAPAPCPTSEEPPAIAFDPPTPRIGQPFTVRMTATRGPRDTEGWPPDGSYTLRIEKLDVVGQERCGPRLQPLEPQVLAELGTLSVANGRGEATFTLASEVGAVKPEAGKALRVYVQGANSVNSTVVMVARD